MENAECEEGKQRLIIRAERENLQKITTVLTVGQTILREYLLAGNMGTPLNNQSTEFTQ